MYNKNKKNNKNSFSKERTEKEQKILTTTSPLNLREGPSKDNSVIVIIPKDAEVIDLNYHINDWYKVKYNNYIGFCMKEWLA